MTLSRRGWLLLLATALLIAGVPMLAMWDAARSRLAAGTVEVQIPDAPRWWAQTADCLNDRAPYPAGVRFYVGTIVPAAWVETVDDGKRFGGYTDTMHRRVLLTAGGVRDSGLVAHELWHVVHGAGHPAHIFAPPRCGLARP